MKDFEMMAKGYRYLIKPTDDSFEPLYVKTLADVTQLLRDYSDTRFTIVLLECSGRHFQ